MNFIDTDKSWLISIVLTSFVVFGGIWTFAEPIGLRQGWDLFFILLGVAVVVSTIYILLRSLSLSRRKIGELENRLAKMESLFKDAHENASNCCVMGRAMEMCPIGITAIHPTVDSTITSSIKEAHRSFKWLGLSAFNVVHNNKGIFWNKKEPEFEFVIANPENARLADEVDKSYGDVKATLGARRLISESRVLLSDLIEHVLPKIHVRCHNQMPTFRLILIDDRKAYVSFYEGGIDALKSVQLEIVDSPEAPYSIFKWFAMFYQKFLITEELMVPKA